MASSSSGQGPLETKSDPLALSSLESLCKSEIKLDSTAQKKLFLELGIVFNTAPKPTFGFYGLFSLDKNNDKNYLGQLIKLGNPEILGKINGLIKKWKKSKASDEYDKAIKTPDSSGDHTYIKLLHRLKEVCLLNKLAYQLKNYPEAIKDRDLCTRVIEARIHEFYAPTIGIKGLERETLEEKNKKIEDTLELAYKKPTVSEMKPGNLYVTSQVGGDLVCYVLKDKAILSIPLTSLDSKMAESIRTTAFNFLDLEPQQKKAIIAITSTYGYPLVEKNYTQIGIHNKTYQYGNVYKNNLEEIDNALKSLPSLSVSSPPISGPSR